MTTWQPEMPHARNERGGPTDIPPAALLLQIWEDGHAASPGERGLLLLRAAVPNLGAAERAGLSVGLRDSSLLRLFAALFGEKAPAVAACPACGEQMEFDVPLPDIRVATPGNRPDCYTLVRHGYRTTYRLPCAGDLAALGAGLDQAALADASGALVRRCVLSVHATDGQPSDTRLDEDAIADLEAALATSVAEADPQAVVTLAFDCPCCAEQWRAPFDIVEFLWRRLDRRMQDLLHDVHLLASRYGWSERDIVALSPWRRRHYLALGEA